LAVSLVSALLTASGNHDYRFLVCDGGLSASSREQLNELLRKAAAKVGVKFDLEFLIPDDELVRKLPIHQGSWLTYARMLLPELLDLDELVYIDADILCLKGVEELAFFDHTECALVAAADPIGQLAKDSPLIAKGVTIGDEEQYFNMGLIRMNLRWMREHLTLRHLDEYVEQFGSDGLRFADQTILNSMCRGAIEEVSDSNNLVLGPFSVGRLSREWINTNLHFIGSRKPWQSETSPFKRYFAECLYYQVAKLIGVAGVPERKLHLGERIKARIKYWSYLLTNPRRRRAYREIMQANRLVGQFEHHQRLEAFRLV
jgi:lipopolysaccharide biosynthesis glycosyltransferase